MMYIVAAVAVVSVDTANIPYVWMANMKYSHHWRCWEAGGLTVTVSIILPIDISSCKEHNARDKPSSYHSQQLAQSDTVELDLIATEL